MKFLQKRQNDLFEQSAMLLTNGGGEGQMLVTDRYAWGKVQRVLFCEPVSGNIRSRVESYIKDLATPV